MNEASDAYAPPAARTDPTPPVETEPPNVFVLRMSTRLLRIAVLLLIVGTPMCHARVDFAPLVLLASFGLFCMGALGAMLSRGSIAFSPEARSWIQAHALPRWAGWIAGWVGGAFLSSLFWPPFVRGRQIRRNGQLLLAGLNESRSWAKLPTPVLATPTVRPGLAAQWRQNGRTEHASVAAFGKLSLDLIALGAPPRLLVDANNDALDEIRHAELCFSIARSLDGSPQGPAPFPEVRGATPLSPSRPRALEELAVDSLVEGVLLEGFSARVVARLVPRCEDAAIRAAMKEIASDEGRHAAHSWDVVEWCLEQGGAPVRRALEAAAQRLPDAMRSDVVPEARDGAWEKYGVPGAALEAEEYGKARENVLRRVRDLSAPLRAA